MVDRIPYWCKYSTSLGLVGLLSVSPWQSCLFHRSRDARALLERLEVYPIGCCLSDRI